MNVVAWKMQKHLITVGASRPVIGRWRDNSPPSPPLGSQHHRRLGRQGLARRRDASTFPASATGGSAASAWQKSHVLPGMWHPIVLICLGCMLKFGVGSTAPSKPAHRSNLPFI